MSQLGPPGSLPVDRAPMMRPAEASAWNDRVRRDGFAFMPATAAGALPAEVLGQPFPRPLSHGGSDVPSGLSARPKRAAAQAARQRSYGNDEFDDLDG